MTRSRSSAKAAGARFERSIADELAAKIDDRIDRRVRTGAKDRGDIANVRSAHGLRVCLELKDEATVKLGSWRSEVEAEAGNDDAEVAVVVHKRRGHADASEQWVTMTVADLIGLITGARP